MKTKQILSSACIYGSKGLRILIIVAALAQLSLGQPVPFFQSADFSISISPSQVVIPPGGTAEYTVTVISTSVAADLSFSITGIPPHSTATFTRESATMYLLTITTSRFGTPQGEYDFTVIASEGGMSASASAELIVYLAAS